MRWYAVHSLKANAGLATEKARKGYRTDYKNCTATTLLYMNMTLPPQLFWIIHANRHPGQQTAQTLLTAIDTALAAVESVKDQRVNS
jgi:hypothetical protein